MNIYGVTGHVEYNQNEDMVQYLQHTIELDSPASVWLMIGDQLFKRGTCETRESCSR